MNTDNNKTVLLPNDDGNPLKTNGVVSEGSLLLSRFDLIKKIGCGGMGDVYKAKDILLNQEIAIKTIKNKYATDPIYLERFKSELSIARNIESENIARVYELFQDKEQNILFFTMKLYSKDDTLSFKINNQIFKRSLHKKEVLFSVLRGIMKGLHAMHKEKLMHRDIKPDNIIIPNNYVPVIIDFGVARPIVKDNELVTMAGTYEYMAPEVMRGVADAQSDLYSAGVVFWVILTGNLPMGQQTLKPPSSYHKNNKNSSFLDDIVMQMLNHDALARQSSADEVIRQLNDVENSIIKKEKQRTKQTRQVSHHRGSPTNIFPEMSFVKAGEFLFGPNNMPYFVESFMIDKFLVTNKDYDEFLVGNPDYPKPADWENQKTKEKHPVVNVSFLDAQAFAFWKGKRLPSIQEWEKAARGTDGYEYPWGDVVDITNCNVKESNIGRTTPVGSYEDGKSPFNCYDMAGNVWEWIDENLIKGGSFANPIKDASCWYEERSFIKPFHSYLGFRCAKDIACVGETAKTRSCKMKRAVNKVENAKHRNPQEAFFFDFEIIFQGEGEQMVCILQKRSVYSNERRSDWEIVGTYQYFVEAQNAADKICGHKIESNEWIDS